MESIRILLIDDEQSIYDIVKHYCKKNSKYQIDIQWYDHVPDDISNVNNNNFDLLLLDYHINKNTGLDVLKMLSHNQQKEFDMVGLPVIMMSNTHDIQIAANALHYGISEFIPKSNLSEHLLNSTINNVIFKNNLKIQLVETNNKLEEANKNLKIKNEEISNFYQVISHELKTPLTSTTEFINILLDGIGGTLSSEQREYLEICKRNCTQLTVYINDLLDIGRISTGKYKLNKSSVNVNNLIKEAVNTSRILAKTKEINLVLEPFNFEKEIEADQARVFQALLILINNAIKFSPTGEEIKITVDQDDTGILISVVDNGCGIDGQHHEKIFDRLFQTNELNVGSHAGLGLGLFICKEIANLHQGEILVESELGKGSKFTLKFPYRDTKEGIH